MLVSGTRLRLFRMPEQASQNQTRTSQTRLTSAGGTVMQHCTLGRTGVQVSTLVLGAIKPGRVRGDGRQGHRRSPRRHRAGYEGEHANGRRAQRSGQFARARKVAADTVLAADVLDAVDAIVAPASTSPQTRRTTRRLPCLTRRSDVAARSSRQLPGGRRALACAPQPPDASQGPSKAQVPCPLLNRYVSRPC
jgi:hypothetical protein